jgi:hypothetical protein
MHGMWAMRVRSPKLRSRRQPRVVHDTLQYGLSMSRQIQAIRSVIHKMFPFLTIHRVFEVKLTEINKF